MVNKNLLTKESTKKAVKRKLGGQTIVHETKPKGGDIEKSKKVPLKAELILNLNILEKEYEALKVDHEALKLDYTRKVEINHNLEGKILELKKNSKQIEQTMAEASDEDTEDLDLSFGPRYCKKMRLRSRGRLSIRWTSLE